MGIGTLVVFQCATAEPKAAYEGKKTNNPPGVAPATLATRHPKSVLYSALSLVLKLEFNRDPQGPVETTLAQTLESGTT